MTDDELVRVGESVRPGVEQLDIAPSGARPYSEISLKELTYAPNFTVSGTFTTETPRSIETLGPGPTIRDVVEFDIDEKLFTPSSAQSLGTTEADIIEVVVPTEVTSTLVSDQETRWVLVLTGVGTDMGPMGAPACGEAGILEFIDGQTLRSLHDGLGRIELDAFIDHLESIPN